MVIVPYIHCLSPGVHSKVVIRLSPAGIILAGFGAILAIDLALLFAGMARFQRVKLVLD